MSTRFLVEIVVCEYDEDEDGHRYRTCPRWTARGRIVSEYSTLEAAQASAERLVVAAGRPEDKR